MSDLILTKENGIGSITLNRPAKKNSFTVEMVEQWAATLEKWRTDPEVSVIVLTGAGKDFCSGADLSTVGGGPLQAGAYEMKQFLWEKVQRIPLILEDIDKPVIAAMKGAAVGAGLDMALMCDIRFASETATFSEGYIKVGLPPGDGGAYFLPRLVGMATALEMLWTGDFVSAKEALRIGLVSRIYPEERLMDETYKFARRLAEGPAAVIRVIKRAAYQSSRADLRTSLDLISSHLGVVGGTQESRDAMRAAVRKHGKGGRAAEHG